MSAPIILTVVDSVLPTTPITLKRGGTPIDLTNATAVKLKIIKAKTGEITNAASNCDLVNPKTDGIVHFTPVITDFPDEGRYEAQATITFPSGDEKLYQKIIFAVRN